MLHEVVSMPEPKSIYTPGMTEYVYTIEQLPKMITHPKDLAGRVLRIGAQYLKVVGVMAAGHFEDDDCKVDEFSLFVWAVPRPDLWLQGLANPVPPVLRY